MYRSNFYSVHAAKPQKSESSATLVRDNDPADAALDSASSLLRMSRLAGVPKQSILKSSRALGLLSLILHSTLVAVHLVLIGIWATALEHRLVFSLDKQNIIHPAISVISNTFNVIYSALLVFVTQTLTMRRSLQMDQTLTATHDNAAAWAGIGSAAVHIWHQKAVPASSMGVLTAFLYLGNILVLHITTPALFSIEAFSSQRSVGVGTQSLLAFNDSGYDWSNYSWDTVSYARDRMFSYAPGSLYFLPSVVGSPPNQTLGLYGGTLYDVLDSNAGKDTAPVHATGFNITCGALTDVDVHFMPDFGTWIGTTDGTENTAFEINPTEPGVISTAKLNGDTWMNALNSLLLYSTIPIIDSSGARGPWINLDPPMNNSVSTIQLFACSQVLTNQTAVVEVQSTQLVSLDPDTKKTTSAWRPYPGPPSPLNLDNIFDMWGWLYYSMPPSDFQLIEGPNPAFASVADLYLIQKLNLHPAFGRDPRSNVTLHEVENALSEVVASMFWTLGHIPPTHGEFVSDGFTYMEDISNPFVLQHGNAMVPETLTQGRLDLSIIMVAVGLAASIALLLLSLRYSLSAHDDRDLPIHGTGMLHAIWLYRNHPELHTLLEQVEHPTDDNLRSAGMFRTRLVGGRLRKQKSVESF
ncbi:hypothetical protein FB451DRAFT_1279822 [Mycena latifolia]|nr:hypothetical protein FB451DRAFT_1279822 [Mycena latifolia]